MPFADGESVGPYRITERLGQGGMATVFRAYHPNLDRYVAIKVLHTSFKNDPSFLARFQREAQIVAKLEHPNIVPVYDYNEHNGEPYLVMKFVEGETLKARQLAQPLSLEETLKTMTEVGQALTYAHEQGVLHRDVKPSNILIDKNGTAYLADFGLARMATAGESTMSQDMMLGTPQYISPEQAQGVTDLDAATDIYSLGVVLYELVVGRVPFNADTPYAIVHDHIYAPLPLPTKVNPQVPPQVERVLLKALAKERTDRYQSAVEMVNAFREAVQQSNMTELFAGKYRVPVDGLSDLLDNGTPAIPAPMPPAPTLASRRARPLLIIGAVVLIVLCLGAFVIFAVRTAVNRIVPTVVAVNNETAVANNTEIAGIVAVESATAPIATENATEDQGAATVSDNGTPAATGTARPIGSSIEPFPAITSAQALQQLNAHPEDPRNHFAAALAIFRERRPLQQPKGLQEFQQGMTMTASNASQAFALAQDLAATDGSAALPAFEYAVAYQAAGDNHATIRGQAGSYLFHFAQNDSKVEKSTMSRFLEYTLSTQSAGLYAFAALANHTLGQDDQASKAMDKAVAADPNLAEVHLVHGILYAAQKDTANAQKEFSAAQTAKDVPKWVVSAAQSLAQQG